MRTFAEFWPHYLRQHAHRGSRRLHAAGTLLAVIALVAAAVTGRWWLALLAPTAGYGAAWLGHLLEDNRPATFGHPLWSLAADLRMAAILATGRLDAHLARSRDESA
jgi:hypothetical protein